VIDFPPVRSGADLSVSASSYVAYLQCPDRALARFRGIYGPESSASFRGNLAHRIFARHLRNGPIDDGCFAMACREEIGSSNLNYKLGDLGVRPSELRSIIAEVGALYERFKRLPSAGFERAEVPLEVDASEGLRLVGVVDAIFEDGGRVRLVDWKTGELGDAQHQLDFYALVWAMQHGSIPDEAQALSVRTGERMELRFLRSDLETVAHRIASMVDDIRLALDRELQLERRGGPGCRFCPLLEECPEGASSTLVLDQGRSE
jgi:hypothetical protein